MANNKVKVNDRQGQSTRPLSSDHITTLDFNVVKPVGIYEMIPGDTIHITPEMWMRTQALACPTFGKVDIITRAFFVPHRLVMTHFLDFWRQQSYRTDNGSTTFAPEDCFKFSMKDLSTKFLNRFKVVQARSDFETHKVEPELIGYSPYDFTFGLYLGEGISPSSASDYSDFTIQKAALLEQYRFNPLGKRVYDLFISMGYRFQFFSGSSGDHTSHNQGENANYYDVSVMPLLSWLKIFQDWYCPSEFRDIFNVDVIKNKTFINSADVDDIFDMLTFACYIFYNDDMFSLCEKSPFAKRSYTDQVFSQLFTQNNGSNNDYISWENSLKVAVDRKYGGILSAFGSKTVSPSRSYLSINGRDFIGAQDSTGSQTNVYSNANTGLGTFAPEFNNLVSAWSVRAVIKAATWLQRNNLLPSRANDYLRAKFGVSPSSERLDIAEYIGSASKPLQISDVVSTEATDNKLGELGGKGTAYSIDKLSYHAEEFGYFFVSVEVRPRVDYGQGVDPLVLRTKVEDFYQQELDGLGFTPVPTQCVAGGPITGLQPWNLGDTYNLGNIENRIFGYLPKYWSYKIKHGNLSGDFGIPNNIDIQSFHLMRYVGGSTLTQYVQNSLSFRYPGLSFYDNQFARIFMDSSLVHLKDHFQMICSFDVNIIGEMLALNESWMVNDEHDERRGQEMEIQSVL